MSASHITLALSADEIQVSGGKIVTWDGSDEAHTQNAKTFVLHLTGSRWTEEGRSEPCDR